MADVLHSITSETDTTKLSTLYDELFDHLQVMESTLQENHFIDDNLDEILQILKRDTDTSTNHTITSHALYHIIPVAGFILNLSQSYTSKNNQHQSYLNKLYFNLLNIIRNTNDKELCIRCLWMFKAIDFIPNNKMESFLPLFYESTYVFFSDKTNKFILENTNINKEFTNRMELLRAYTLQCYTNLFCNNNNYQLLINKSHELLHSVIQFLLSNHNQLQKQTIEFLTKFINHIKTLDGYNSIKYENYNKIFSSDQRLFKILEIMIGKDNKNDKNTIYKFKDKKYNNTPHKQIKNIKIWSIITHCLGSQFFKTKPLCNRILKFIQSYFTSNPVETFQIWKDFIFVLNLNSKNFQQGLKLCHSIFKNGFSTQTNRSLGAKLECLNCRFYTISVLCKHNMLFKSSQHKNVNIPYKTIIIPLLNMIKSCDKVIGKNIIMCMIQLLKINNNNHREISPHDIDMKDMETLDSNHNKSNINESMCTNTSNIINIDNESDLMEINRNIKEYKWKFEYWKYTIKSMIVFGREINKRFGNDLCMKFIQVFVDTFFKTIVDNKHKLLGQYLVGITTFIAEVNRYKCDEMQWEWMNNMAGVWEIYFKYISEYESGLKKLKWKGFKDGIYGIKLDDFNGNVVLFSMKLFLNKCEKFELFPVGNVYDKFMDVIKGNNNVIDCVCVLEMYEHFIEVMLLKLNGMNEIGNDNGELKNGLVFRNICCVLSHVFKQVFNELLEMDVVEEVLNMNMNKNVNDDKREIYDKVMDICGRFMVLLCKFIAVFDVKCNENGKCVIKMEWFEENEKNMISQNIALLTDINDIIHRVLNNLRQSELNKLIINIYNSLLDNDELIVMKWCKYTDFKIQNDIESDLVLIIFGDLLLQLLYKSNDNWYNSMDNKQLFGLITSIFLYIMHRNNDIEILSNKWIKLSKHFIKSFNKFLCKLSTTEYVNIWCRSISNRLLYYIKNEQFEPSNQSLSTNNDDVLLYDLICECFKTYIQMTCNHCSMDNNIQIKVIIDSDRMKKEYPLLHQLYDKYKQKETQIYKSPEITNIQNEEINNNKNNKITKHKTIGVTTRSRRRAVAKTNKQKEKEYPILKFTETQYSFDPFADEIKDENKNNKNVNDRDNDNDIEMTEEDREPSKSVSNFNINDTQLNPNDLAMQQEFDINESSKGKSKSISLDTNENNNNQTDKHEMDESALNNENENDINKSLADVEHLESKCISFDINEGHSENNKNENELESSIRSTLSGNKRKLNDIIMPKTKKMKINSNENNEIFYPLLVGYTENINCLLNMLPRKIRLLVERLPFNTINELAECEYNKVVKYLMDMKHKNKNTKSNVEYEIKEIKNIFEKLVIVYNKEKEKGNNELVLKEMTTTTTTTDNDNNNNDVNINDNDNDNDNDDDNNNESLDCIMDNIELKLNTALEEFKGHNEWNLYQITKIHKIVGEFNDCCIQSTISELKKNQT